MLVMARHFIGILDTPADLPGFLVERAAALKKSPANSPLAGRTLALLFEKPSLRTRVSFDVGMAQLGGRAIYLSPHEVGLGQREPVADVARVLGRYVDAIAARTFRHETVQELAAWAGIPVINALSDFEHPCQAIGDLLTVYERFGTFRGITVAFIGDGNNVANSLVLAAASVGLNIRLASPPGYEVPDAVKQAALERARVSGANIRFLNDPWEAVQGANVVYTDVWTSMGQEAEADVRRQAFAAYRVTPKLMAEAAPDAVFMHDLPAHRGEEVDPEVIDGPKSVVFDQAENRLHGQKAILLWVFDRL
jgi:ornithine carbamoyltransferase